MTPIALTVPFNARDRRGTIRVTQTMNDRPLSIGCPEWARGFPTCHASVHFGATGYTALFGWVQLVRMATPGDNTSHTWVCDPLQIYDGLETPVGFYGIKPELFDAPARSDRSRSLDWRAESYLCFAPSKPMARQAKPVAAFSWGFVLEQGTISAIEPTELPLTEWAKHLDLLQTRNPTWEFLPTEDPPDRLAHQ